jgi:nitrilase
VDPVKAAVIQQAPVFLNIEASLEKACALIEQAADHGADVIAFPETWLPGYPVWLGRGRVIRRIRPQGGENDGSRSYGA